MTCRRRRPGRALARAVVVAAAAGAFAAACALRLGGPGPETYRVLLASPRRAPDAVETGGWVRALDAHVAFIATDADSAWFAATAAAARMTPSGPALPGSAGSAFPDSAGPALGFLAWEPVGDTTLVIGPAGGTRLLLHDALYRTDRRKPLDLMIATIPAGADAREVTRTLLTYVATDVMHDAIVLLALRSDDRVVADSVGALLRPVFSGAAQCRDQLDLVEPTGALRLYYSPVIRVRCEAVRGFGAPFPALLARVVLGG